MSYDLERYAYLWNQPEKGWVLLKAPDLAAGHCIFNELGPAILLIEDEQLNILLCERMREAGCKILDEPPGNFGPVKVEPFKEPPK